MLTLSCEGAAGRERAISTAVSAIKRGDLVFLPTESVYAIAADPFSRRGVAAIRAAKGQSPGSPLPLMVPGAQTVQGIATGVTTAVQALMQAFWPGPMTLLLPSQPSLAWDLPPELPVAVRMPIHPLILAILERTGPMIVTTANAVGGEAPKTLERAVDQLGQCAAVALDVGVMPESTFTSTVIDVTGVAPAIVREGALSVAQVRELLPELS